MNLLTLNNSLDNQVWAMPPLEFLSFKQKLTELSKGLPEAFTLSPSGDDDDDSPDEFGRVFLCVDGPLMKGTGLCEEDCDYLGITDLDYLEEDLREARDNPAVSMVVLIFNSPGGTSHVHSTALLLQEIQKEKDVLGYVDTMACSAAYELAAMCSALYVSATAWVGFIGTIFTRADYTGNNEQNGVAYTFITSSPKKLYLNPNTSITDEEQQWIESAVMYSYQLFKDNVLSNRQIADEYLDASILIGEQSVEPNLSDGVIVSFDDFLKKLNDY